MPSDTTTDKEEQNTWKQPATVRWYNVPQLARTGVSVVLSTILGEMIDSRRIINSSGTGNPCVYNFPQVNAKGNSDLWFDYMADTGDGWIGTYTMAYFLTLDELNIDCAGRLPRGRLLILGGDQVYPVASKKAYARRLAWPFNVARDTVARMPPTGSPGNTATTEAPALFALPGNHDWYDGLDAFTRRLCSERKLGIYETRQRRSYFVITLPHNWEVWGIDLQLRHDLDIPQLEFFRSRASQLTARTHIILCAAEPIWVFGAETTNSDLQYNLNRVRDIAEEGGHGHIVLEIAGDIHNYQRYSGELDENGNQRHTVVSGGGGAFLHPTHSFAKQIKTKDPDKAKKLLTCVKRYPCDRTSKKLAWLNCFFPFFNPEMIAVLGIAYLAMFGMIEPSAPSLATIPNFPLHHPWAALLMAFVCWMFIRFADVARPGRKILWGGLHSAAHLGIGLLAVGCARQISSWHIWGPDYAGAVLAFDWPTLVFAISVVVHGGVVGSFLFGLYLLFSLNVLHIHHNEAFSALRIDDYKHFLRCKVSKEGLEIFVIGIDKLQRRVPLTDRKAEPPLVQIRLVERFKISGGNPLPQSTKAGPP